MKPEHYCRTHADEAPAEINTMEHLTIKANGATSIARTSKPAVTAAATLAGILNLSWEPVMQRLADRYADQHDHEALGLIPKPGRSAPPTYRRPAVLLGNA